MTKNGVVRQSSFCNRDVLLAIISAFGVLAISQSPSLVFNILSMINFLINNTYFQTSIGLVRLFAWFQLLIFILVTYSAVRTFKISEIYTKWFKGISIIFLFYILILLIISYS